MNCAAWTADEWGLLVLSLAVAIGIVLFMSVFAYMMIRGD